MLHVQSRWRMCPQTSHGVICEAWLGLHFSLQGVWKRCWEAAHTPFGTYLTYSNTASWRRGGGGGGANEVQQLSLA